MVGSGGSERAAAGSGGSERAAAGGCGGSERAAAEAGPGGSVRAAAEAGPGRSEPAAAVPGRGGSEPAAAVGGPGESKRASAVAGPGESERAVAAASGESDRAVAVGSGEGGKPPLLHALEYPCTKRLRLRRLLACIRKHSPIDVYITAREKTYVIFDVKYLVKKVREGQWREASYYLGGFTGTSYEFSLLTMFLFDLLAYKAFADGNTRMIGYLCDWLMSIYKKPVLDKHPCFATVVTDVLFLRKDHASSFLDWELVRKKAAKMVEEMAYKVPELRDRMQYPRSRNSLYHFIPIGSKRHVKHASRKQSSDLAQCYLQMKKRLFSLSPGADYSYSEPAVAQGEQMIALFDTCFEAGRLLRLEQGQFPEVLSKEDFPYFKHKLARGFRAISSKQAKLSSKIDTSQRPAVVGSSVTNSGTKRSRCFQESKLDTVHPGNFPKRPRTDGKFGDGSIFKLEGINEGTA